MWANFRQAGADRLLLVRVLDARSLLRQVVEAVPGAEVTVVRFRAPLAVLQARIRSREASDPSWFLGGRHPHGEGAGAGSGRGPPRGQRGPPRGGGRRGSAPSGRMAGLECRSLAALPPGGHTKGSGRTAARVDGHVPWCREAPSTRWRCDRSRGRLPHRSGVLGVGCLRRCAELDRGAPTLVWGRSHKRAHSVFVAVLIPTPFQVMQ